MNVIIDLRKDQLEEPIQELKEYFGEDTQLIVLNEKINPCIGCWSCWLKTPGKCVFDDVMTEVSTAYVNSNKVALLFDTGQGFINYQMKAFLDRSIPHYHPYIEIVDGECHHLARYDAYPELYYYYESKDLTEIEEQVIEDYLYRTAYHFQSPAFRIHWESDIEIQPLKSRKPKRNKVDRVMTDQMEKLIIYNGSPRKSGSNTAMILENVKKNLKDTVEVRDLKNIEQWEEWIGNFESEKNVLFMMPLYVHAMPSHVMRFIEKLKPSKGSIAFILQSGFPESSQSYFLEAYFEELSKRLKRKYLGTAIKGGVEGLQIRPDKQQQKIIKPFVSLIHGIVKEGRMNPIIVEKLAKPIYLSKGMQMLYKILKKIGVVNLFWNSQLKKNKSFDQRFAKPYEVS